MQGLADIHWTDIAGCLGAVAYLAGFALQQVGRLAANGAGYALSKLLGSGLMLVSLSHDFNLSSWCIQTAWLAISLATLFRIWRQSRRKTRVVSLPRDQVTRGADNLNIAC